MRILLLRHGETAGNLEKRYVGRTDEGLTEAAIQGCGRPQRSGSSFFTGFWARWRRCTQAP